MKLLGVLCGLRYSPRNGFGTMGNHLDEISFAPLKSDSCAYIFSAVSEFSIPTLYDDYLIFSGGDI